LEKIGKINLAKTYCKNISIYDINIYIIDSGNDKEAGKKILKLFPLLM